MFTNYYYNKALRLIARMLRNNSVSKAEKIIWKEVLSRKQIGLRALRQRPIDKYIVDFLIPDLKLIIEIDGSYHELKGEEDAIRQTNLEALGYFVFRLREQEILNDLVAARNKIQHAMSCLK